VSGFLDRHRRAGPYLAWKVRSFTVAAMLGLSGIYFDEAWLSGAAIVVLFAGLSLRLLPAGDTEASDEEEEDEDGSGAQVP
jgi:hypothetical protein